MTRMNDLWNEDTLDGLVADQARDRPDAPAMAGDEGALTFGELADRVERIAAGLAELGIATGDVVSVQLPNRLEFPLVYLAAARLGAVLSTIHMPYGPLEAAQLMRTARSKAVVCMAGGGEDGPADAMLRLAGDLPALDHVIAVGGEAPLGAIPFRDLAMGSRTPCGPGPAADMPFLLLFTSGTSSSPKGVMVDYRRFLANARLNHAEMKMGPDSVMMSAAPYTHLLGIFTLHLSLYAGGKTVLLPEFSPHGFVEALHAYRPTHVFTAPAHLAACEAHGLLESGAFEPVRYMVVSGATAPPSLYRRAQEVLQNGSVAQVWGMTELQCGIFHRPGEPIEKVSTTCGRPAPGFEARVADGERVIENAGGEGELQVRGVSLFSGYFENPEATAGAFTADGWFRTGDLARIDEDGYVSITGRAKDIINRGGVKINPVDVEEALARHPAVAQCAIAPVSDPVLGERACLYVVPAKGHEPVLEDMTAWLAEQGVAKIKWPEKLVLIDEMPLTPTRKVIKGRLDPDAR